MTLLARLQNLLEGGGELLRAESEIAAKKFERALRGVVVQVGLLAGGLLFGLIGLGVILAGVTVELAALWGVPLALGATGGFVLLVGLVLLVLGKGKSRRKTREIENTRTKLHNTRPPETRAAEAKLKMKDAVTRTDHHAAHEPGQAYSVMDEAKSLKDEAIEFAKKNPAITGAAALFVISFLGPGRVLRFASRGMAVAGLASKAYETFQKSQQSQKHQGGAASHHIGQPPSPSVGQPAQPHASASDPAQRSYANHSEDSVSRHTHS